MPQAQGNIENERLLNGQSTGEVALQPWLRRPTNVVKLPHRKDKNYWIKINVQLVNAVVFMIALTLQYTRTLTLLYWAKGNDRLTQHYEWYSEETRSKVLFIIILLHLDCLGTYIATSVVWYWHYAQRPWVIVGVGGGVSMLAAILSWVLNRVWRKKYTQMVLLTSGHIQV